MLQNTRTAMQFIKGHFLEVLKPPKPISFVMWSSWSTSIAVSLINSRRAFSFSAFFNAFLWSRSSVSFCFTSSSRRLKSYALAEDAALVLSRSNAIRAWTCASVDLSNLVVCPSARRSLRLEWIDVTQIIRVWHTCSTVDMVQIACTILVRSTTRLAIETRLARSLAA